MAFSPLYFATQNKHKLHEAQHIFSQVFPIEEKISLRDLSELHDGSPLPEPYDTLEKNAQSKASHIYLSYGVPCFSEDTGLFVKALNGRPGVHTARFAKEKATDEENIEKLLYEMRGLDDRTAYFGSCIALCLNGLRTQCFHATCPGSISYHRQKGQGFGYDPVFIPQGHSQAFSQLPPDIKNGCSHRRKAIEKMAVFLKKHLGQHHP